MRDLNAELDEMEGDGARAELPAVVQLRPAPSLSSAALPPQWERCKGWIAASLEGDSITLADVEAQLASGDAMLWPGSRSAIVSEIVTYPSGRRVGQPVAGGGDLAELAAMLPGIEAWARAQGCAQVRSEGRRGWERVMRPLGYRFHSTILVKDL